MLNSICQDIAKCVAVFGLVVSVSPAQAQDDGTSPQLAIKKSSWSTSLPGVYLSEINVGEMGILPNMEEAPRFFVAVDGKVVYESFSSSEQFDGIRSDLKIAPALRFGALSIDAQLNLEKQLTNALNADFENNGEQFSTGLSTVNARTLLEKALVTIHALGTQTEDGEKLAIVDIYAGRGETTPMARFVTSEQVGLSVLRGVNMDQTDLVGVAVSIPQLAGITARFNLFGNSFLPYLDDDGAGDRFENIDDANDEFDSWSVSVEGTLNKNINWYVSFADVEDFVNINDPSLQAFTGQQYEAGLQFTGDRLSVQGALVYKAFDDSMSVEDQIIFHAGASYALNEARTISAYGYGEGILSDDETQEGIKVAGGLQAKTGIVTWAAEVGYIMREDSSAEDETYVGLSASVALGGDPIRDLKMDTRQEPGTQNTANQ